MIEPKGQQSTLTMDDLIITITSPRNGDQVHAAGVPCSGTATPNSAVTVSLFNPSTFSSAAAEIPVGGFMGNTWNTTLPAVNPLDFPGPSVLIAEVNPPDGPVYYITVYVVP
jgi:hypothetical protein